MPESPVPLVVAKAYLTLLQEVKPALVMWQDAGKGVRASELLADAEQAQPRVVRYAQALLSNTVDLILREAPRHQRHFKPVLDVTVSPRSTLVAVFRHFPAGRVVYKTMSHTYGAQEMANLLEAGDPEALRYASDALRIARDLLAREAM